MIYPKIIFILSLLIISVSSLSTNEEDLIDLTNYKYPHPNDTQYTYIPILSTNDFHGGIFPQQYLDTKNKRYKRGGANYLYSYKKILKEEWGDRLLWFDAGDFFQGTIECMLSDGLIMKDYFNKAGLNAVTLGNHDFDYQIPQLKKFITQLNFPLICSNIKEKDSGKYIYENWDNVVPYKIYNITIDQSDPSKVIKIGAIGLATYKSPSVTSGDTSNLIFTDYVEETKKWNNVLRNEIGVNAVIVITHFGPACNNDGAEKYNLKIRTKDTKQNECDPEQEENKYLEKLKKEGINIDAVVAGHVHNVVHHWISDIPVVQSSGSDYFNIIYLPFTYKEVNGTYKYELNKNKINIEGPVPVCEKLWPTGKKCSVKSEDSSTMKKFKFHQKEINIDPEMKEYLQYWENIVEEKLGNIIAYTEDDMTKKTNEESFLPNFINDLGRIITDSDICFFNNGGIRSSWYKGPITEIDNFKMFPFNNTWVRFEMTGEEVFHMIQNLDEAGIIYPSSGLIQTFYKVNTNFTVKSLLVYDGFGEKPLNPQKTYKICTNDFLAGGGSDMGEVRKWYKELRNKKDFGIIRDLIKNFLKNMKGKIKEDKFIDKNYPRITIE